MTASEEEQQIRELVARLADKFPHLATGVVGEEVRGIHREFVDHRVREFIPLLVERIAERQLRRRMAYRAPTAAGAPGTPPRTVSSMLPGMVQAQGNSARVRQ
ncbi:hypothetical protein LTV02_05090 [Nocardia yamanashiensis]|uniref:three-helix bundle dimerization domain-containing protein n=1 Tax=Nocardia yamanashiensis TaxID=209247 RepID=UPI001E28F5A3|nr:hypothetical protein [Nocardia yamanashiensis]UGT42785.1 hypothetical protein LTV02_05090 [Nocardia yamanashiensis]